MGKQTESCELVNQSYLALLDETQQRCNEVGVALRLYVSPQYSEKSEASQSAIEAINGVSTRNEVFFYDFSADEPFIQDSTLFKDASHMNDNGARLYTEIILNSNIKE